MSIGLLILIAALFVTCLVFSWIFRLLKATIRIGIYVVAIALILQLFFGISPNEVLQQISQIPQKFGQIISD